MVGVLLQDALGHLADPQDAAKLLVPVRADALTALRNAAKGNPIAVVYPTDGAVAVLAPSGVIKGAKNQNAGK